MATQAQPLRMYHLPREVLDLIIGYVLRDTLLELSEPLDIHRPEFDAIVRANNTHLADLDDGLALLLLRLQIKPPPLLSRDLLIRHATFCFQSLENHERLSVLHHLQVTTAQYEIPLRRCRYVDGFTDHDAFAALRTLTVSEVMRAGANSSTRRSVAYRLRSDRWLRRIAGGFNGVFDQLVGFDADGREITKTGRQRCRMVLKLRVETVVPVELTVSVAVSCVREMGNWAAGFVF
jgi:hypothetical protein